MPLKLVAYGERLRAIIKSCLTKSMMRSEPYIPSEVRTIIETELQAALSTTQSDALKPWVELAQAVKDGCIRSKERAHQILKDYGF